MGASWQAFYAHLCAASIIRAMPETEIPPAMRGDLYLLPDCFYGNLGQDCKASQKYIVLFLIFPVRFPLFLSLISK